MVCKHHGFQIRFEVVNFHKFSFKQFGLETPVVRRIDSGSIYARQLLNMSQVDEAFKVFKSNYDKYPNRYTTNVGMGRAYSAKGDYKTALTYMKAALVQAPDEGSKTNLEAMITKLKDGQNVN